MALLTAEEREARRAEIKARIEARVAAFAAIMTDEDKYLEARGKVEEALMLVPMTPEARAEWLAKLDAMHAEYVAGTQRAFFLRWIIANWL